MVDAELILTGEEPEGGVSDTHLPFSESIVLPKAKSLEKQMGSAPIDEDDSDLDAIDRYFALSFVPCFPLLWPTLCCG